MDQRKIGFFYPAFPQVIVQLLENTALFGNEQNPRSIAIQPVNQFQEFLLGPHDTQRLYHAQTDATASMDSQTGWLVKHDQAAIFVQNGVFKTGFELITDKRRGFVPLCRARRRHPHGVTFRQLVFRLRASFINTHFTLADHAVNGGFRNPLESGHQEVVDSLTGVLRTNIHQLNFRAYVSHVYGISRG